MPSIRIELFGSLQITIGAQPLTTVNTNRLQSLLAFLVLNGETPQSREQLASLLWPESSDSQARTNLRQLLHHLRRALPAECCLLESDNQTVRWRRDPICSIDVLEFDAALARASTATSRGDITSERQALEEATQLYQDDLARGLYDDWLLPKRDHYRQQLGTALSRLASLHESNQDYAAAIHYAERLVAIDPLRESHHQLLIHLHASNGDRASALRAYHQCMRVLRRELGVEPGAATRKLFETTLKGDPPPPRTEQAAPAAAVPVPLVGRKLEWDRLLECWRRAAQGPVHLAAISGEPGIGKSRLADELSTWCSQQQVAVAHARCYAAEGKLAYGPVGEWLRSESLSAARALLSPAELVELARVLPEILSQNPTLPKPQPLTESWQRHYFFESLTAAFGKANKPLLLIIDDLQWCDQDTFEWLHCLFRSEAAARILVAGTIRSEETGRSHPFTRLLTELRQSGHVTEVALEPLNFAETAALAARVSDRELQNDAVSELYSATKGNPLFVLESVRAGVQGDSNTTPPRIHAVIAARLAQLSAQAYELAGMAAAIGRSFSFDLLAKATDWDEDSVTRALDELWQRRIVEGNGAAEYDFTHDRLREVAYDELTPVRRRYLHRRVARALEELNAAEIDSISAQLAAHYEAAGMAEAAIQHYRAAAAVAQQRFADTEAAGLLRRALALCTEFPESPRRDQRELELLLLLGPVLVTTQGYTVPEVGETYARALELSRRLGDRKPLFSILSGAWVFHVVCGNLETSRQLAKQFFDLANEDGAAPLLMAGNFLTGCSLYHLGQIEASEKHMVQALTYGVTSHAAVMLFAGPDIGVFCHSYRSHLLWHLGRVDESVSESNEAVAAANRVGHPFGQAIALNYAAMLFVYRHESHRALEWAERAVEVCRKYNFAYYGPMAEILAGWAHAMAGEPEAGLAQLRYGLDALRATGGEVRLPFYHGLLAECCALTGQMGEALANISTAFAYQSKNGELWAAADLHRIQGDLLRDTGSPAHAQADYQRAIEIAERAGTRVFELRAASRLYRLAPSRESRAVLERVYTHLTEGHASPDMAEARSLLETSARNAAGSV